MKRLYSLRSSLDGSLLQTSTMRGVEYLVVPVVSKLGDNVEWPINAPSPEFIPSDVLKFATHSRNGRPFTMNHPRRDGEYVSANDPDILEKYQFGFLANARFEDGEVRADVWIDPLLADSIGGDAPRVIERLQAGETIEVSEGDFVVIREESGEWNGRTYGAVWELCISDHLAALPEGTVGACANTDGCGAGALKDSATVVDNEERSKTVSILVSGSGESSIPLLRVASTLTQARTPTYSGTESSKWSAPSFTEYVKYLHEGKDGPKSVSQCTSALKQKIAAHSLLGDPEAGNLRDLTLFPCVNPANGKLNENALQSILGSRGDQADISESALTSARDVSRRLLNKEFGLDLSTSEANMKNKADSSIISRLFASMSSMANILRSSMSNNDLRSKLYKALKNEVRGLSYVYDEDVEAKTVKYCVIIRYGDYYSYDDYDYRFFQRTFNLDASENVTLNDDAIEIQMYEDGWKPVTQTVEPEEVIVLSEDNDNKGHLCSCQKGDQTMASKKELIEKLKASGRYKISEETLNTLTEETLASMVEVADKVTADGKTITESKVEDGKVQVVASDAKKGDDSSPVIPITEADWWKNAPAHLRDMATRYQQAEQEHRTALVDKLKTASAFTEEKLKTMETGDLETLAESLKLEDASTPRYDFSGRGFPVTPPITTSSVDSHKAPRGWDLALSERKGEKVAN